MVTGATLHKQHFFAENRWLRNVEQSLLKQAEAARWEIEAWSVFSNHYHFVGRAADECQPLGQFIGDFHSKTAISLNNLQGRPGRTVWYQFWDRCLTYEASYFARLNYVFWNPVHHRLVTDPAEYPFCSAYRLRNRIPSARRRKILSYKFDRVKEPDAYEPIWIR